MYITFFPHNDKQEGGDNLAKKLRLRKMSPEDFLLAYQVFIKFSVPQAKNESVPNDISFDDTAPELFWMVVIIVVVTLKQIQWVSVSSQVKKMSKLALVLKKKKQFGCIEIKNMLTE